METVEIRLREEYIKLGQALKAAGAAESGVDAKLKIQAGEVCVNHKTELQRGKKLRAGDEVTCEEYRILILQQETTGAEHKPHA